VHTAAHWLTAPALTPTAAAICRWDQPFSLWSQAWRRRASLPLEGVGFMPGRAAQPDSQVRFFMLSTVIWRTQVLTKRELSSVIPVSGTPPGGVQGVLVLVRRLRRDRLMTARTEAILPTIPAPKRLITTQTGGESHTRVPFRGSTFPGFFATHGSPQRSHGVVQGAVSPLTPYRPSPLRTETLGVS
jgi:hypothetical protein